MLDTKSGFENDPNGRSYALGAFALSDMVWEADSTGRGLRAELHRHLLRRHEILRLKLLGNYFSPSIHRLRVSGPTVLDAYCQSPRYFLGVEDALKEELAFKDTPPGIDPATASEIYFTNSVCVHARRLLGVCADRTKTRRSLVDYYGACGISYYRRALARLARERGPVNAYLFSDNLDWARENASQLVTANCAVKVIAEQDTLKCFYLMRLCKHFVLANSTFGWWAAWLGESARKAVYVPSVWNRGEKRFPLELFPDGWNIVPAA